MSIKKYEIKKGINLYYVNTTKFKTTTFSIYIQRPLDREECTLNSLLSMLLRRSSAKYPDSKDLARYLDNLYGTVYSSSIRKKADRQVFCFVFQFINDKFLTSDENILSGVIDLSEDSVLKQTHFNEEYVKQEKENLKSMILSVVNDKRQYASKRCIEIMCEGEAYGISKLGYIEDIEKIDSAALMSHYKNTVLKSPVDIFVNGDVDIDYVLSRVKEMFSDYEAIYDMPSPEDVKKEVKEIKNITEEQQIVQGKISMGFRTNVYATDKDYPAMMLYNSILGSGIFSKLFNNVREKLSLCYYASSSVDYLKGIMTINSGIEIENYQKAYDEILVQMEDIKNGVISETEMSAAILGTVNSIVSISDNPVILDDYYLSKLISGDMIRPEELVKMIEAVTKEQVVEVAKKIQLDTVYFLKGCEK